MAKGHVPCTTLEIIRKDTSSWKVLLANERGDKDNWKIENCFGCFGKRLVAFNLSNFKNDSRTCETLEIIGKDVRMAGKLVNCESWNVE